MTDPGRNRELHYVRSGKGRPLVLLHGWCMTHRAFHPLLDDPPAGFEIFAFDLPGHGESPMVAGDGPEFWAEAVALALERLALEKPVLCGWSLGGMLALLLAGVRRLDIAGLVLVGTTPRFTNGDGWTGGLPPGRLAAMRRDVRRSYRPTMESFFRLMFTGGELDQAAYRQVARRTVSPRTLPSQQVAEAGLELLARTDLRALLPAVDVPVLVAHGAEDAIIPAAAGQYLADTLSGARLEVFSGVGHAPFLSRPERFRQLLEAFLP
ncbi:MAG: alpha/beta fold hydrolase [Geothermobacteraceae bacterium]